MKRRWNGIDRALLVLALCALAGGVWLGWKKPWRRTAGEELVCTLRLPVQEAILQNVLAEPAVGDAVRTTAGGETVGRCCPFPACRTGFRLCRRRDCNSRTTPGGRLPR